MQIQTWHKQKFENLCNENYWYQLYTPQSIQQYETSLIMCVQKNSDRAMPVLFLTCYSS